MLFQMDCDGEVLINFWYFYSFNLKQNKNVCIILKLSKKHPLKSEPKFKFSKSERTNLV